MKTFVFMIQVRTFKYLAIWIVPYYNQVIYTRISSGRQPVFSFVLIIQSCPWKIWLACPHAHLPTWLAQSSHQEPKAAAVTFPGFLAPMLTIVYNPWFLHTILFKPFIRLLRGHSHEEASSGGCPALQTFPPPEPQAGSGSSRQPCWGALLASGCFLT